MVLQRRLSGREKRLNEEYLACAFHHFYDDFFDSPKELQAQKSSKNCE